MAMATTCRRRRHMAPATSASENVRTTAREMLIGIRPVLGAPQMRDVALRYRCEPRMRTGPRKTLIIDARGCSTGSPAASDAALLLPVDPGQVRIQHHCDELGKRDFGLPAKPRPRLCGVAAKDIDLGRPKEIFVDDDVVAIIEPDV